MAALNEKNKRLLVIWTLLVSGTIIVLPGIFGSTMQKVAGWASLILAVYLWKKG